MEGNIEEGGGEGSVNYLSGEIRVEWCAHETSFCGLSVTWLRVVTGVFVCCVPHTVIQHCTELCVRTRIRQTPCINFKSTFAVVIGQFTATFCTTQ